MTIAPAVAAETPAANISQLQAKARIAQTAIDQMNYRIELLAEAYDGIQEALAQTTQAQAATAQRYATAELELADARDRFDRRIRAIYVAGPGAAMNQILGASTVHVALNTRTYQQAAVASDGVTLAELAPIRGMVQSLAARLAVHREELRSINERLARQRTTIEQAVSEQRAYLARMTAQVKQAVAAERARQAALRRQAFLAKLAAERSAVAKGAIAKQAASEAMSAKTPPAGPQPVGSTAISQAIAFARAQLGKPYLWGGVGPGAYDCSGLTMMAYRSAGVFLWRTAAEQYGNGSHVAFTDLRPGDLVFWASDPANPATIHHEGMYLGSGMMIEAPHTGDVVKIAPVYLDGYVGATRVA